LSMPGIAKRKYVEEIMRFNKSLKRPLKQIIEVLPYNYDADTILTLFKELYPFEWQTIDQRYQLYKEKDKFLAKQGEKIRYRPEFPENWFLNLPIVKTCLKDSSKERHKKNFSENTQKENLSELRLKRKKSIDKKNDKIENATELMQNIEPLYIDVFIAAYHKKGIKTERKIEIFKELQKYNCDKSITFFYKLNDSERNNQIRQMAFFHLQSIGRYVKLRKGFKGNKKSYMTEKNDFIMTPKDLMKKIESNNIQSKKIFDLFISHSSKDSSLVKKIIKGLNKHSLNNYCDWTSDSDFLKRELVSDYTRIVLKKRLIQAKALLVVRTPNSIQSDWVDFELKYFKSLGKPLFCINLIGDEIEKEFSVLEYDESNETIKLVAFAVK